MSAAKKTGGDARRGFAEAGMKAAIKARGKAGVDQIGPVCVYDLAEKLGVTVRFTDINMEGMYDRLPKPRIHLSSLRPLPRRVFTCAHELGHHELGHGSTIDEMKEDSEALGDDSPNEVLANSFAGFVLMPTVGLRGAFARRGCSMVTADEMQMFAVACNFGVGYATIVSHLRFGIREIDDARMKHLLKASPKSIRQRLLGDGKSGAVVLVDPMWTGRAIDAEIGTTILLPPDAKVDGTLAVKRGQWAGGLVYEAVTTGIGRVEWGGSSSAFLRVSKKDYVGLARYRHLEDDDV